MSWVEFWMMIGLATVIMQAESLRERSYRNPAAWPLVIAGILIGTAWVRILFF